LTINQTIKNSTDVYIICINTKQPLKFIVHCVKINASLSPRVTWWHCLERLQKFTWSDTSSTLFKLALSFNQTYNMQKVDKNIPQIITTSKF